MARDYKHLRNTTQKVSHLYDDNAILDTYAHRSHYPVVVVISFYDVGLTPGSLKWRSAPAKHMGRELNRRENCTLCQVARVRDRAD